MNEKDNSDFLPVRNVLRFDGPQKLGYFSVYFDDKHNDVYCPDKSSLKYLNPNKLSKSIDCAKGFNLKKGGVNQPKSWENFFRWVAENEPTVYNLCQQKDTIFLCSNKELENFMLCPFTAYDWQINAGKFEDFIVISLVNRHKMVKPKKEKDETNRTVLKIQKIEKLSKVKQDTTIDNLKYQKLAYARFNTSRWITKRVEKRKINSGNETDVFNFVSFSRLDQHQILYFGPCEFLMRRDDVDKPIDKAEFGALKIMQNVYGKRRFLKIGLYWHSHWWSSSLICGVEKFIIGDIKDDFTIEKFDVKPISKLNSNLKKKYQNDCLISLDDILSFIESEITECNKTFSFYFDADSGEISVNLSEMPFENLIPFWFTSGEASEKTPVF